MSYIDDFIAEAEKDNRVGDFVATVKAIEPKTWPSGDPFDRLIVELPVGGTADCNIQAIPSEEALKAVKAGGDRNKIRAIASSITLVRQLEQHYGTADAKRLMVGMPIEVKTVKTKVKESLTGGRTGGFIRVIAFLAPGTVKGSNSAPAADAPPF